MVLEKILKSPLDYKDMQPVHPKGDTKAEAPILWQADAMSPLIGKDPDAGKY